MGLRGLRQMVQRECLWARIGDLADVGEGRHLRGMREPIMDQRINYGKLAPEGIRALGGLETYLRGSGLDPGLLT